MPPPASKGWSLGRGPTSPAVLALADATMESVLTAREQLPDGGAGVLLVPAVPRLPGSKRRYAVAVMRPQVHSGWSTRSSVELPPLSGVVASTVGVG